MNQQTPRLTQLVRLAAVAGVLATVASVFPIEGDTTVLSPPSRQPLSSNLALAQKSDEQTRISVYALGTSYSERVAREEKHRSNLVASGDSKEGEESHENTFLDDATCVNRGKAVDRTNSEVVVGKQLYTSIMQMPPGVKITCRLRKTDSPPKFQSLSLLFGLDDDSKFTGARIIVYKDGEKATSNISSHGEVNKLVVNVKDAHSITLEIDCPPDIPECKPPKNLDESEKVKYTVHFFQATLDPISVSDTQRSSRRASITQQQAVQLIEEWLQAKKKIFAPPYDRDLAAEITTGELYKYITGEDGEINRLKQKNAYYQYGEQKNEIVKQFVTDGESATIQAKVTEDIKFYQDGDLERKESSFKTRTVIYNLQFNVGGRWKIAEYKIIN